MATASFSSEPLRTPDAARFAAVYGDVLTRTLTQALDEGMKPAMARFVAAETAAREARAAIGVAG